MKKGFLSSQGTRKRNENANGLKQIANSLFHARDKEPYVFNGKPLKNFQELKDYIVAFTEKEALWVASWIGYLGDAETAKKIREDPLNFKRLIYSRYEELLPFIKG